jgi:hypothetical protein
MGSTIQSKETVRVRVLLDPVCPWTWRAALWIREARKVRPVAVDWGLLSLEYINRNQPDHPYADRLRTNRWAMRLLARAGTASGNDGMERLYFEIGEAVHERGEELDKAETLALALSNCGLPAVWLEDTQENPGLDGVLWKSYEASCATGAFGVPTLFFGGDNVPYYGPVIDRVPTGEDAGDLWDHIAGLARHQCFFELKRPRS